MRWLALALSLALALLSLPALAEVRDPHSHFFMTKMGDFKEELAAAKQEGNAEYRDNTFDLMTFRDRNITTFEDDHGNKKELRCDERYYVPSEITWLLKSLGFASVDIFGARLGAYSRADKLTTEDFEMLVVAEKRAAAR